MDRQTDRQQHHANGHLYCMQYDWIKSADAVNMEKELAN